MESILSFEYPQILNLDEKKVFLEDSENQFFNIEGINNPLTYGKTAFKISSLFNDKKGSVDRILST